MVPSPGNPQSLNRYSYTLNNPVKYTDPTGHYVFEEDPSDPWIYSDPKVRSKQYYTHPEYKQGEITDAQFVAAVTSPIWVPITAVGGAEEAGELWFIAHGGIKALIALLTGALCGDGDCTNEAGYTARGWFDYENKIIPSALRKWSTILNRNGAPVWASNSPIDQPDVAQVVDGALANGQKVCIYTGCHGNIPGQDAAYWGTPGVGGKIWPAPEFFIEDLERWGTNANVEIKDMMQLGAREFSGLLNRSGMVHVCAWCYSQANDWVEAALR
jgi:hypothetical protein